MKKYVSFALLGAALGLAGCAGMAHPAASMPGTGNAYNWMEGGGG